MTLEDKRDELADHLTDHLAKQCHVKHGNTKGGVITITGADGCTYTITVEVRAPYETRSDSHE
jgi:VCBS repeat-containing protein